MLIATLLLTRKTSLGMFIESVGANPTAARFSGINAKNIFFWCYVFTGFCTGIAGIIVCSNVRSADGNNAGLLLELDAILAVVLGGTAMTGGNFYLLGSMVGALIIQTLTTSIYALGVPPEITQVVNHQYPTVREFSKDGHGNLSPKGDDGMKGKLPLLVTIGLFILMFGYALHGTGMEMDAISAVAIGGAL